MESKKKIIKKNKKKKLLKRLAIVLLLTLVGIIAYQGISIYKLYYEISYDSDEESINIKKDDIEYTSLKGVKNILLLSSDAREDSDSERPDSIMILTIDANKKEIRTTSILRDTYVEIGEGYIDQKINHAYSYGGIELMINVIQRNFDIKIDNYAIVNFQCFKKVIDLIGGIEAEIKDYEVDELNEFILEYGTGGTEEDLISMTGLQNLNGKQALSYARIRKVGNGDYERAERQRYIIKEVVKKGLKINPLKYNEFLKEILPYIRTNLKPKDILNIAYNVVKMNELKVEGMQIPVLGTCEGYIANSSLGWVLFFDKDLNKEYLHSFIFNGIKKEYSGEDIILNDGSIEYEPIEEETEDEIEVPGSDELDGIETEEDYTQSDEDENITSDNTVVIPDNEDDLPNQGDNTTEDDLPSQGDNTTEDDLPSQGDNTTEDDSSGSDENIDSEEGGIEDQPTLDGEVEVPENTPDGSIGTE